MALQLPSLPEQIGVRPRLKLDSDAIAKGINEDVISAGHTPDSTRHQHILDQLRLRLLELDLYPEYDQLIDCIVEIDDFDVYFEVKSSTPDSVVQQVRAGLGQVLHYLWMDSEDSQRAIRGHLVVEGPWTPQDVDLQRFAETHSIRLTWSQDVATLGVGRMYIQ